MLVTFTPRKSNTNQIEVDLFRSISSIEGVEECESHTRIRIREKLEEATRRGLRTTMRWQASNVDGHHYSIITFAIDPDLGAHIATVLIR